MEEYAKQLLRDAGVPQSSDDETMQGLVAQIVDRATDMINRRLIDAMSDEDAAEFDKLLQDRPDDVEAVQQFIDQHVPDKQKIAGAALLEFRALYLGKDA